MNLPRDQFRERGVACIDGPSLLAEEIPAPSLNGHLLNPALSDDEPSNHFADRKQEHAVKHHTLLQFPSCSL